MKFILSIMLIALASLFPSFLPDSKGAKIATNYYHKLMAKDNIQLLIIEGESQLFAVGVSAKKGIFFQKGIIHVNIYITKEMISYEGVVDYCKKHKKDLNIERRVKLIFYKGEKENRESLYKIEL